jgi:hypothetical protein
MRYVAHHSRTSGCANRTAPARARAPTGLERFTGGPRRHQGIERPACPQAITSDRGARTISVWPPGSRVEQGAPEGIWRLTPVLLDTGCIVGLLDRSEQHHRECVDVVSALEAPLITCDPEVIVDEDVSHPDDLRPRDFWRSRPDGLGESASNLTDDLEVADDPTLDQLICFKCLSATGSVALDAGDGFEGVAEPLRRISQSGTASRKTRARMLGLSPFSEMTSTGRPSRTCRSMSKPPMSSRLCPGSNSMRKSAPQKNLWVKASTNDDL